MARVNQEKISAVRKYLQEELPQCLIDYRRDDGKNILTATRNFIVVCSGIFHFVMICDSVWINHDSSSLYSYLKRISLAKLLRENPHKPVIFRK